jgi:hypothetical protein
VGRTLDILFEQVRESPASRPDKNKVEMSVLFFDGQNVSVS